MVLYILSKARPVQYCTGTTDLLFQGRPPHVLYGNLTVASSSQDMEAKKGSPKISSGGGGGGGGGGGQAKELMEKGSLTMDEYQFERKKIFQDYPGIADIVPR